MDGAIEVIKTYTTSTTHYSSSTTKTYGKYEPAQERPQGVENHYLAYMKFWHVNAIRDTLNLGIWSGYIGGFIEEKLDENDKGWNAFGGPNTCAFVDGANGSIIKHYTNVLRTCGRYAGLYPTDDAKKGLQIDEVVDMISIFRAAFAKSAKGDFQDTKAVDRMLIQDFRVFDELIERNLKQSKLPYVIGDTLTTADVEVANLVNFLNKPVYIEKGLFEPQAFNQEFIHVKLLVRELKAHPAIVQAAKREEYHRSEMKKGQAEAGYASSVSFLKKFELYGSSKKNAEFFDLPNKTLLPASTKDSSKRK